MIATLALGIVAVAAPGLAAGDGGDRPREQRAERRAALDEARALWRRRRLPSYRYRVQRLCFCVGYGRVRITVRGGRPRETPKEFATSTRCPTSSAPCEA